MRLDRFLTLAFPARWRPLDWSRERGVAGPDVSQHIGESAWDRIIGCLASFHIALRNRCAGWPNWVGGG